MLIKIVHLFMTKNGSFTFFFLTALWNEETNRTAGIGSLE